MPPRGFAPRPAAQTPQRQLFAANPLPPSALSTPARNSPGRVGLVATPGSRASPGKAVVAALANKVAAPATPATPSVTDSPGNWRHPRLDEITRRRGATVFNGDNVKTIIYNGGALVAAYMAWSEYGFTYEKLSRGSYVLLPHSYARVVVMAIGLGLLLNIIRAVLPLFRQPDNLSDIPLTPGQRKLLGLSQLKAAATPGAVYSTPPRYARTPSVSGSAASTATFLNTGNATAGSSRSYTGSPISGSPLFSKARVAAGAGGGSPYSAANSPFQSPYQTPFSKAVGSDNIGGSGSNARRSSFGSPSAGVGGSSNSLLFGESTLSGTPSPGSGGKRLSVGLNNKWLYEKGRRSSGSGRAF